MKKILTFGFAAVVAATMTLASSDAFARPFGWGGYGYGYGYHPRPGFSLYLGTPFFFGFQAGPRPYYRSFAPRAYMSRHAQWCSWRFRTYNAATNTYHPQKGVTAVCVSPYWR